MTDTEVEKETALVPTTEAELRYAVNKLFPKKHRFTLRLNMDTLYFGCDCCNQKVSIREVERMLNQ